MRLSIHTLSMRLVTSAPGPFPSHVIFSRVADVMWYFQYSPSNFVHSSSNSSLLWIMNHVFIHPIHRFVDLSGFEKVVLLSPENVSSSCMTYTPFCWERCSPGLSLSIQSFRWLPASSPVSGFGLPYTLNLDQFKPGDILKGRFMADRLSGCGLAPGLASGLLQGAHAARLSILSAILRSVFGNPGGGSKLSTLRNALKGSWGRGLVRPSATCSCVGTYSSSTCPSRITSRSQYCWIPICLVRL